MEQGMSDHLHVHLSVADYSKWNYKFFAHLDESKAREPKNIQRLRKCANKNAIKAQLNKGTNETNL